MVDNFEIKTNGAIVKKGGKVYFIEDTFKLTRSAVITLTLKQKIHINNFDLTVDEDIHIMENEMMRLFQGRYETYVKGKFDPINLNLVIEKLLQPQGW